jgi:hypothetical protein
MGETFWASRDIQGGCRNHIKIWNKKPKLVEPNGVFAPIGGGGVFLGMFDAADWTGPNLEQGQKIEIKITFEGV